MACSWEARPSFLARTCHTSHQLRQARTDTHLSVDRTASSPSPACCSCKLHKTYKKARFKHRLELWLYLSFWCLTGALHIRIAKVEGRTLSTVATTSARKTAALPIELQQETDISTKFFHLQNHVVGTILCSRSINFKEQIRTGRDVMHSCMGLTSLHCCD